MQAPAHTCSFTSGKRNVWRMNNSESTSTWHSGIDVGSKEEVEAAWPGALALWPWDKHWYVSQCREVLGPGASWAMVSTASSEGSRAGSPHPSPVNQNVYSPIMHPGPTCRGHKRTRSWEGGVFSPAPCVMPLGLFSLYNKPCFFWCTSSHPYLQSFHISGTTLVSLSSPALWEFSGPLSWVLCGQRLTHARKCTFPYCQTNCSCSQIIPISTWCFFAETSECFGQSMKLHVVDL